MVDAAIVSWNCNRRSLLSVHERCVMAGMCMGVRDMMHLHGSVVRRPKRNGGCSRLRLLGLRGRGRYPGLTSMHMDSWPWLTCVRVRAHGTVGARDGGHSATMIM